MRDEMDGDGTARDAARDVTSHGTSHGTSHEGDAEGAQSLVELTDRLRRVADAIAGDAPRADDATHELAHALDAFLRTRPAPATPGETHYARLAREQVGADAAQALHVVGHPLMAGQSPVFPQLEIVTDPEGVSASLEFGAAFEGPPGLVHGGFVSAGFDIVVSLAAAQVSPWSMTRRLQIRFLRPTFLHQRLSFRAHATEGEHRSIHVRASLHDADGRTTAKAQAEFVRFEPERFADRRSFRPDQASGPDPGAEADADAGADVDPDRDAGTR